MALFGVGREEAGLRYQEFDLNISGVDQLGGETSRNFEFFSLLKIDYKRAEHGLELAKLCRNLANEGHKQADRLREIAEEAVKVAFAAARSGPLASLLSGAVTLAELAETLTVAELSTLGSDAHQLAEDADRLRSIGDDALRLALVDALDDKTE